MVKKIWRNVIQAIIGSIQTPLKKHVRFHWGTKKLKFRGRKKSNRNNILHYCLLMFYNTFAKSVIYYGLLIYGTAKPIGENLNWLRDNSWELFFKLYLVESIQSTQWLAFDEKNQKLKTTLTSRERPKLAPYLRLKNSKRTSKCQVFSSTIHEWGKNFQSFSRIFFWSVR